MTMRLVPDDIVLKAHLIFRFNGRKYDEAAAYSSREFFAFIESGKLSTADARKLLSDNDTVTAFIEENRKILKEARDKRDADVLWTNKTLLEKTHANSEKTLTSQNAMHTELKSLIGELCDTVKLVKDTTATNEATAKAIGVQVTALEATVTNTDKTIKKIVRNTSTITAVLVGFGVGFVAGFPSSYIYERTLSVAALSPKPINGRKQKDTPAAGSPPPDKDKQSGLVIVPYGGLNTAISEKRWADFLNDEHPFRLFKQDGSFVCLQLTKPTPCVDAEVPKSATKEPAPHNPGQHHGKKVNHKHQYP